MERNPGVLKRGGVRGVERGEAEGSPRGVSEGVWAPEMGLRLGVLGKLALGSPKNWGSCGYGPPVPASPYAM